VNASVGVALANGDARTGRDLLRDADTALLRAKQTGKPFELFDTRLRDQLLRQVTLTRELERAISEDTFDLVYQPIVSLTDGRIHSVEQLARWTHPDFDTISPEEFIPLAEKTGLIVPLGRLLIERAAMQVARWRLEFPDLLPGGICVNLAGRELEEADFAAFIDATLTRHGLTSRDIELELTERVFIDERHPTVSANLRALSAAGHRLVLDDFGSGYSALSSLKRLPLWALKIDKFFTAAIHTATDAAPVTRAVVGLGRALDMHVTAEGIETQTQLDYARAVGVDHGQGYLLAAPQPADDVAALLRAGPLLMNTPMIAV
jgi:EAL domain-containing protein (putative c-di-GMP-specific phosphodiesterase class I)